MKIYSKKGVLSFTEKKLKKALEEHYAKHPEDFEGYETPTDVDNLKAWHDKITIKDTPIISETSNKDEIIGDVGHDEFLRQSRESLERDQQPDLFTAKEDPMNRESPKIRDYVLDDGFTDTNDKAAQVNSSYEEPKSFRESFEIPDENTGSNEPPKPGQGKNIYNSPPPPKKEHQAADPDAKLKRKSRKKFTRHAVNAVCALAGKGIVWYATKDITDAALAKAIAEDEISEQSLKLLVWLDNGTQGAVKTFFQQAIGDAQDLANFTEDEKLDLIEALDDFLEYKKIEISPGVELGAVFMGIMLDRALKAVMIKAKASSILDQLKDMHKNTDNTYYRDPAAEQAAADPAATEPEQEQQSQEANVASE